MKTFLLRALASAFLSTLFLVLYPLCNYITSLRGDVPSFVFSFEHFIPFLPALILPYMSIDLFFVAAPFLARTPRELRVLTGRIALAILLASACFLLFPLRFAFVRPEVTGLLAPLFNNFRKVDLPFNEFPSLHVGLALILLDFYWRRFRGSKVFRELIFIWFVLILLSPVFTYQHHVIDVIGGVALGVVCFYFVRGVPLRQPFTANPQIGLYYLVGFLVLLDLAFMVRPYSYVLLYPAFSLGLAMAGYFFLGAGVYRKEDGRLPLSAKILLLPLLLGQWISLRYYARRCNAYDVMTPQLLIGRRLSGREFVRLPQVTGVLDLTAEFSEPVLPKNVVYLNVPILDLTAPTPEQMETALQFLVRQTAGGVVYVHCKVGYSRTAAIAGAYLLATQQCTSVGKVVEALRRVRPSMIVRPEVLKCLGEFAGRAAANPAKAGAI